ncbi:MAG: xylulose kinase [Deltaproteobacteria bacterium]|jgi:xylulokinase|nr:xylulose kinase [Deltaproteobacteria bacterium]MBW2535079.1 xylulose kinase [Deltaproteobacteria bacterium]
MSEDLVLGVDCSTTACKAIAWDATGQAQAEGRAPIDLQHPAPDAWEQDADQWWTAWVQAIRAAASALGERARTIRALCVTHQRETFVLADERGAPLHPAVVWMDGRCTDQVEQAIGQVGAERLHDLSGKPPCTTPSLYKLLYLLAAKPELAKARPRVLDVHAFVVWRATGRCATSLASADPTGLVDMRARAWSPELCALAGLDESQLPELCEPGAVVGRLTAEVAESCGLPSGLPVIAGAGDGQAAGLGAGIAAPGRAYVNLGTAVVAGVLAREYCRDRAFRTLYGAAPGTFFCESDLKGGTFTLSWLVERLLAPPERAGRSVDDLLADLEQRAGSVPAGSEGLVLVPYLHGVMNPYWDDDASGILVGLSGAHGSEHLYRAILEGIAFEQRLALDAIADATAPIEELVVLGGGAKSDLWCQILADVTGRPVVRARSHEATALGAGVLAAVAAGLYPHLNAAVSAMSHLGSRFTPSPRQAEYAELYDQVYRRLYPLLQTPLSRLAALRRSKVSD